MKFNIPLLINKLNMIANETLFSMANHFSMVIVRTPVYKIGSKLIWRYTDIKMAQIAKIKLIETDKTKAFKEHFIFTFTKKKKNGKKKRLITSYNPWMQKRLEAIYIFLKNLLPPMPYYIGGSTGEFSIPNAAKVLNQELTKDGYLCHFDIKNWFDSITTSHIYELLESYFEPTCLSILVDWLTFKGRLPQGNPCSSLIANLIAHTSWGTDLHNYMLVNNIKGFIYLDDVCFVCKNNPNEHLNHMMQLVEQYGFQTHKDNIQSSGQRQQVLGVIINKPYQIRAPKKMRKKVRALLDKAKKNGPYKVAQDWANLKKIPIPIDPLEIYFLKKKFYFWIMGIIAWISYCNPEHGKKFKEIAYNYFHPSKY